MLGWVITCHDDKAEELLSRLEKSTVLWRNVGRSISGMG